MQIINGEFVRDETSINSRGGTEIIASKLAERLDKELLKEFQIVVSRENDPLDESKIRLFWAHDLPGDPASDQALGDGRWNRYHRIVAVSNWQMQAYINHYNIPYSKFIVLKNFIDPIEAHEKPTDVIRLAYWSTPHRGLNILVPVFEKLCEKYDNIELDVYSSFNLYGWGQRDEQFKSLFDQCKNHPKINYVGTVDNSVIRENLKSTRILAYPSIWAETSCIVLMEAMSAGLVCVHPNYGALPETAANFSLMYQWHEDLNAHANIFYGVLDNAIENINSEYLSSRLSVQTYYANIFYGWQLRKLEWEAFLRTVVKEPREFPKPQFVYKV